MVNFTIPTERLDMPVPHYQCPHPSPYTTRVDKVREAEIREYLCVAL